MSRWHVVLIDPTKQRKRYTSLGKPLTEKEAKTFLSKMPVLKFASYCLEKIHDDICGITIGVPEYSEGWGCFRLEYRTICQKPLDHKDSCLVI